MANRLRRVLIGGVFSTISVGADTSLVKDEEKVVLTKKKAPTKKAPAKKKAVDKKAAPIKDTSGTDNLKL